MTYLLALDPGLDATGWALFERPAERPRTLQGYDTSLINSGVVTTKPTDQPDHIAIPARADALAGQLAEQLSIYEGLRTASLRVAIETPAIFGPYRRKGPDRGRLALGMARSMAALWYVIGRLEGHFHAGGARIDRVRAAGAKVFHHTTILQLWPHLPTTKTGPSEDHRDAVALGLRWMESNPQPRRATALTP